MLTKKTYFLPRLQCTDIKGILSPLSRTTYLFRELFTPARFRRKNPLARRRKPPWLHPSDADREGGGERTASFAPGASPADWFPVYPVAVGGSFDDEVAFDLAAVNKRRRRLRCCADCPRAFSVGLQGGYRERRRPLSAFKVGHFSGK